MKLLTQLCNLYPLNPLDHHSCIINRLIISYLFFLYDFFLLLYEFTSRTLCNKTWQVVRINIVFFFIYFNYPRRRETPIYLRFESECSLEIGESAFELVSRVSRDIFSPVFFFPFFWKSQKSGEKYLF